MPVKTLEFTKIFHFCEVFFKGFNILKLYNADHKVSENDQQLQGGEQDRLMNGTGDEVRFFQ